MKQSDTYGLFIFRNYIMVLITVFVLLIAGGIIIEDVLPYFSFNEKTYGHFVEVKWSLIGHLVGALLALFVGLFQFWKAFRDYNIDTHQTLGKIYVTAVVIGAGCASCLAWTSALAIHWTWSVCLQVGAFFWLTTVVMAVRAILQKRIQSHKEWMIRSYILTIIFVFFRWLIDLPFIASLGNFVERAPTVAWFSLAIPLFITEVILQWNSD